MSREDEPTLASKIRKQWEAPVVSSIVGVEDELMLGSLAARGKRKQVGADEEDDDGEPGWRLRADIPLDSGIVMDSSMISSVYKRHRVNPTQEQQEQPEQQLQYVSESSSSEGAPQVVPSMHLLQREAPGDQQRALGAQTQSKVWRRILTTRVRLQKAMLLGDRLPAQHMSSYAIDTDALVGECRRTIQCLHRLQNALSGSSSSSAIHEKQQPLDQLWQQISEQQTLLWQTQQETIEEWSSRVALSNGAHTGSVIYRSPLEGITNALSDMDRLIARSQVNRTGVVPIGDHVIATQRYDDCDLYHYHLKQFIELKTGAPVNAAQQAIARSNAREKKPEVDRRASKGRKIRFNTHDKLVHFCTTVGEYPLNPVTSAITQALFK